MVLQNGEAAGADGEEVEPGWITKELGLVALERRKKVSGFEGRREGVL